MHAGMVDNLLYYYVKLKEFICETKLVFFISLCFPSSNLIMAH